MLFQEWPRRSQPSGLTPVVTQGSPCPPPCPSTQVAIAQANLRWGLQYCYQQRFPKALKSLEAALCQYSQLREPIGIGKSLNGLSAVYLQTEQYGRSRAYSQAASIILADTPAQSDFALAVYQLGVSYLKLHDLSAAQRCLEAAAALYHGLSDPFNEDRVLLHLGQLYTQRQEFMSALACYEAVLDSLLMRTLHDQTQELLFTTLDLMMQLCVATDRGDCAIIPFQEVLDRYIASGNQQQIAQLFRQLGQFHETQERYAIALECYARSLQALPPADLT